MPDIRPARFAPTLTVRHHTLPLAWTNPLTATPVYRKQHIIVFVQIYLNFFFLL